MFNLTGLDAFVSDNNPDDVLGNFGATVFQLRDSTNAVFSNDSLPTDLNLADFDTAFVRLTSSEIGLPPSIGQLIYDLTSVSLQQVVPEPSTTLLFGTGMLVGYARRRNRLTGN